MSDTLTVSNINYKTLLGQTGSSLSVGSLSMASTVISLGASTNQAYNNFSNGSYTTGWGSTLGTYNVLSSVKKVTMSQSGQYQYALQTQSSASTYPLSFSQNSGVTWTTLGGTASSSGLPTGSLAYASTSSGVPAYSNFSQSANGQYALALVNGGLPYVSNNANTATPVFTAANVGAFPYVYLPFDNSVTDLMGNSVVTATGAPSFTTGKVGTKAITFANTAGGTATQYVRGTWTPSSAFTISFWFNATTLLSGSGQIELFMATNGTINIYINQNNNIVFGVNGGAAYTSTSLSTGVWYNVVAIGQVGGLCSLYLNNSLVGSFTNSGGFGTSTGFFGLGTTDLIGTSPLAFNGSIDDLRIYNSAVPNAVSPYAYLPFEGNTTDAMGNTITATGSPGFVQGIVGSQAVSLANTMGSTAIKYIRGPWTGSNNFMLSGWFNAQTVTPGQYGIIFSALGAAITFYIGNTGQLTFFIGSSPTSAISTSFSITPSTWYSFTIIYQLGGTSSLYVNGVLIGSVTNTGATTYTLTGLFCLGTYDNAQGNAFNGFIDDFRIYNYANSSPIVPMNYSYSAVSATGQYMMVAASTGGMFLSSTYGASWSAITASQIAGLYTAATGFGPSLTTGGQVITPQLTGLAAASWTQNGVNWVSSASPVLSTYYQYKLFDTSYGNSWAPSSFTYTTAGNSSGINTTIQGIGSVQGDWAQLQSSVPLVMSSYQFSTGGTDYQFPKTYYIIGSNDGTTWYPIQYGLVNAKPSSTPYALISGTIIVNSASSQTFGSSTVTTTAYSTTTTAYTYFRLLTMSNFNSTNCYMEIGEWLVNFATPPAPLYVSPSASATALTVSPQQTGLVSNTWTASGVGWVASSSSSYSTTFPQYLFNNTVISTSEWISAGGTYSTAGNTSGYTTTIQGVSSVQGDWVQIQSSIPLVMSSYQFATAYLATRLPKTYWILGSTDGTTWYPIQYGSGGTVTSTASFTLVPGVIIVATAGAQTFGSSSVTFTTYATTTNAYTYFRLVGLSTYNSSGDYLSISEWFINFTAYTPPLLNALTMSSTGQYLALTGAGSTSPNLSGLAASTWTQNGVGWTASSTAVYSTAYGWHAFDNAAINSWVPTSNTYSTTGNSSTSYSTTFYTTYPTTQTVQGDWLQVQSSIPLVMSSYNLACGYTAGRLPKNYYIVGSNDGTTWYGIQSVVGGTVPTVPVNYSLLGGTILVNSNSVQALGNTTVTTATYTGTTNPYTYFRMIVFSSYNSSADYIELGEWYINFQGGPTYLSTNYGATWTTPLGYVPYSYYANAPAVTLPNANLLAISGNGTYMLQGTNLTVQLITVPALTGALLGVASTPTFSPALAATVNCASISLTGQYMVVLTQGTTNNVYYSTNYGVTFTGLTIGSSPMTGCAISNDGSYLTVSNATTMYTLNLNAQGYAVSLGNAAGQTNQGSNAIAIGNQAGQTNQSASSIVLNASGSALNAYTPGFFVAPIASYGSSTSASFALLGYGSDNQVVQTSVTVLANGYVGIGTTNPGVLLQLTGPMISNLSTSNGPSYPTYGQLVISDSVPPSGVGTGTTLGSLKMGFDHTSGTWGAAFLQSVVPNLQATPLCLQAQGGFVGIGTTNPQTGFHVNSAVQFSGMYLTNSYNGSTGNFGMYIIPAPGGNFITNSTANSTVLLASGDLYLNRTSVYGPSLVVQSGTGNVGIGTTNPGAQLHISNSSMNRLTSIYVGPSTQSGIVLDSTSGASGRSFNIWSTSSADLTGVGSLAFFDITASAYRMVINSSGNVGIGTANPQANLHVNGSTLSSVFYSGTYVRASGVTSFTVLPTSFSPALQAGWYFVIIYTNSSITSGFNLSLAWTTTTGFYICTTIISSNITTALTALNSTITIGGLTAGYAYSVVVMGLPSP